MTYHSKELHYNCVGLSRSQEEINQFPKTFNTFLMARTSQLEIMA